MMLLGGDYSKWDPIVDWKAHDWKYAFIKASEGTVEDKTFRQQWEAAKGHVYRGAYHFFRPYVSWSASAMSFINLMNGTEMELPPVLDLEVLDATNVRETAIRALSWLGAIRSSFGITPIVYTSPGFINLCQLFRFPEFANYPLWLATYSRDTITSTWTEVHRRNWIENVIKGDFKLAFPKAPAPWKRIEFLQWTAKCPPELVPGYPLGSKKAVDINFYWGNLESMQIQFSLQDLPSYEEAEKPITLRAKLKDGQFSRLRIVPGTSGGFKRMLKGPVTIEGIGNKVQKDGYWWIRIVRPDTGWVALTTSYTDVRGGDST